MNGPKPMMTAVQVCKYVHKIHINLYFYDPSWFLNDCHTHAYMAYNLEKRGICFAHLLYKCFLNCLLKHKALINDPLLCIAYVALIVKAQ